MLSGRRPKLRWAPSSILGHLQTWRTQYHYQDDREYTNTREQGIQTCRKWILYAQSPPMGLWIVQPNFWHNLYPDRKTRM